MLCDGGGSNPADTERSQAHLFRSDLQRLVNDLGIEIRVAHYPPYASKYNPIEHRVFPHLTRRLPGSDPAQRRPGRRTDAEGHDADRSLGGRGSLDKVYETGRKVSKAIKDSINLVRDAVLPRWNYRILPNV